jgi:hypothetical protein
MKDRLGSWLLLTSTDLVAANATAARVMNHVVAYVDRILTMAHEQGLGVIGEESIEIVRERLDDYDANAALFETVFTHALYALAPLE